MAVPRTLTGVDVSVVLAIANVASLAWFAATLAHELGAGGSRLGLDGSARTRST